MTTIETCPLEVLGGELPADLAGYRALVPEEALLVVLDPRIATLQAPDADPVEQAAAFESIVAEFYPRMREAARNIAEDYHKGEDAAQTGLESALLKNIGSFKPQSGGTLSGWLTTIASNAARDRARREKWRGEQLYDPLEAPLTFTTPGNYDDPAEACLDNELMTAARRAIDELPDEFREVAALCILEELPNKTVAEQLGIPYGTVSSRLSRGRYILQHKLHGLFKASIS